MNTRRIELTREIHRFATDQLNWDECIALLEESMKDPNMMSYLTSIMELIVVENIFNYCEQKSGLIGTCKSCDLSNRLN